jgi:DNA-directed RNA polymerase subunit RPC12/RpoP
VRLAWLLVPLAFGLAIGFGALAFTRPDWLTAAVLWTVLGLASIWVMGTVLWPARAERACPQCGEERLVRADPSTTMGVRCEACGHQDMEVSSWFLAEDEGDSLEEIVLSQRRRGRR